MIYVRFKEKIDRSGDDPHFSVTHVGMLWDRKNDVSGEIFRRGMVPPIFTMTPIMHRLSAAGDQRLLEVAGRQVQHWDHFDPLSPFDDEAPSYMFLIRRGISRDELLPLNKYYRKIDADGEYVGDPGDSLSIVDFFNGYGSYKVSRQLLEATSFELSEDFPDFISRMTNGDVQLRLVDPEGYYVAPADSNRVGYVELS